MFEAILMDFGWIGLLLLAGTFLRAKVKLFQKLYIPVSVVGGFLGLLIGPQVLGRFCPVYIHWSENVSQFATPLLAMLFATSFFGITFNIRSIKRSSAVWAIATMVLSAQFLLCIPIARAFGLNDLFSLIPQSAFYGGHGIPGVLAGIWDAAGAWAADEVFSIGTTFATIGLLWGVIIGIILINIGARRGWLASGDSLGKLSEEENTGYVKPENRKNIVLEITKGQAINPLAFHVATVFFLMLASYGVLAIFKWCAANVSFMASFANLNVMVPALIVSLVFGTIANKTALGKVCDADSIKHVGGTALEFLICSSVANTNLDVVLSYGAPIFLMSVVALVATTLLTFGLSKIWLRSNWFEHGVMMMGAYTGVLATGVMLLRIADPNMETDASVDIITASPFWTLTSQNFFLAIAPVMALTAAGFTKAAMISAGLFFGLLIFGMFFYRKD